MKVKIGNEKINTNSYILNLFSLYVVQIIELQMRKKETKGDIKR